MTIIPLPLREQRRLMSGDPSVLPQCLGDQYIYSNHYYHTYPEVQAKVDKLTTELCGIGLQWNVAQTLALYGEVYPTQRWGLGIHPGDAKVTGTQLQYGTISTTGQWMTVPGDWVHLTIDRGPLCRMDGFPEVYTRTMKTPAQLVSEPDTQRMLAW